MFIESTNQNQLRSLQSQALFDRQRGLLTEAQLLNIIYRLDRISHVFSSSTQGQPLD